jgi:class 3 adenylate cyclase
VGSVETVTILITDLVGSTELESRVGAVGAHAIRVDHFELIRSAVEEAGGRDVKNTGDGLIAVFGSATAGVSCATAVQQRFDGRNRSARERLMVKVGLSAGDATLAEDGDYFGMPVIEAARLCDRCAGGQILANELVTHLAGGRGHTFKPVGALDLKGLPEPLATVEVVWERQAEGWLVPLPPPIQEEPSGALVGRAAEMLRLRESFAEVISNKRRLALLAGEPGMGKTCLATHMALEARSQGAVVLLGRSEAELAVPYGPWVEALSHLVEHAPEEFLQAHAEAHGGELTRLVPSLRMRIPGLPEVRGTDPETERYLMWGAVLGILREAAERDPLVLVLEDLHWADKSTLLLLKHVLARSQGMRALIIGTYRDSDLHRDHPLAAVLADLRREEGVERLAIGGLGQQQIAELMERAAGQDLGQAGIELSQEILRETGGNSFYIGELLRYLLDTGVIFRPENGPVIIRGDRSDLRLPQSVRELVGRRIERLGDKTRAMLTAAAVIGRQLDLGLLADVIERAEDELPELLKQAVALSVLSEPASAPGTFSFAHFLISRTLYVDLGATGRALLHRRVAEALEELLGDDPGVRVGELARHWAKAAPFDRGKAVTYATLAGERALAELAPHEAVRLFTQALDLLGGGGDAGQRCDLLIGLGEAQRQIGEPACRLVLLEASQLASGLQDADRAARAALANYRGHASVFWEVDQERLDALDRAIELGQSANPARRATLISRESLELQYDRDHTRRRALAEEALELARQVGDAHTLAQVLRDYIDAVGAPDTAEHLRILAAELAESARASRDPALEFWAAHVALRMSVQSGDVGRAEALLLELESASDELGQPTLSWYASYLAAGWAIMRGELTRGERLAERALAIGNEAAQPDAIMVHGAQLTHLRLCQGRGEEVIATLEQAVAANARIPAWRAGLAAGYCWLGRHAEAAAIVEEAVSDGFDDIPWDHVRMVALALYSEAASQTGSADAAALLYELLEPWAGQVIWNGATGYGLARTYLGLLAATLGWNSRADEHFAIACEFHETKDMPLCAARSHLGWAENLVLRGEHQRARGEARRTLELSRKHGYAVIEPRANAIVQSHSSAGTDPQVPGARD